VRIAACLLAALPLLSVDKPDLIVREDGKEIECRVLFEDDATVVYTTHHKPEEIARSEVASVQSIERSLREALDRYAKMPNGDAAGLLELADFCEERELLGEARNLRIRVLTLDPENETAWTKLGGVHSDRRGWRMKVRGRFLTLDDLRARVSDWKNALELPTAHFLIKSDADPERALDLALDVERAYLAFYDLLGHVLRLDPFEEVPEIHVYSSGDDAPRPPAPGWVAWVEAGSNALSIDGTAARENPGAAVAELADLLLWNSMRRTAGRTGTMPAWARSALGQAFAAAFHRDPGRATWDLSQPITAYFRVHASAEKPLDLDELVNSARSEYDDGTKAELYRAQAYTLLHWLAHADGEAHRAALGEYLIGAYKGQGSATHLRKALDLPEKEIEASWLAWAKANAGG
jgi:hypothetical protein